MRLGYLGFEVRDLSAWEKFVVDVLGLEVGDRDERTPDAASFAEALAIAVPETRWSSGRHRIMPARVPPAIATIPSPPPDFDDAPPSSAGSRVQFFRRDAIAELRRRGLARGG